MAGLWWKCADWSLPNSVTHKGTAFTVEFTGLGIYYDSIFWHKVDIHLDLIKLVSHFSDRWIFEFSQRAIWTTGGLALHYH